MPDQPLNPDGIEAACVVYQQMRGMTTFGLLDSNSRERVSEQVSRIVSAYLAHARPVVSTLEELDKLPIGSVILDADNDAGIVEYDGVIFCETHKLSKEYVFKHYRNLRVIYTPEGGTE